MSRSLPAGVRTWLSDAVVAGGGSLVDVSEAEALVWAETGRPEALAALLASAPQVRWVQLPWAGIEPFAGVLDAERVWTCGKGVYAEPVAEHALALLLAGLRSVVPYARAQQWTAPAGRNLLGGRVTIVGAGGITSSLLRLLGPFGVDDDRGSQAGGAGGGGFRRPSGRASRRWTRRWPTPTGWCWRWR